MFNILDVNDWFGTQLKVKPNNHPKPYSIFIISPPKLYIDLDNTKIFTPYEYDQIGWGKVDNNYIYSKNIFEPFEYREKAMLIREPRNSWIHNLLYQFDIDNRN
jgi:hypothetical protein